jgi:hypothetical protein
MAGLGPIDPLVETFGPFVFPVLLFVGGLIGYALLVALGRAGLIDAGGPEREPESEAAPETETERESRPDEEPDP